MFLKDQPIWQGVDQVNTDFEVDQDLYMQFKEFLFDYFQLEEYDNDEERESKWCSSIQNALTKKNENALMSHDSKSTNKVQIDTNYSKHNGKGNRLN